MDHSSNVLLGQYGQSSKELVNLLIHGKACSNFFNDTETASDNVEKKGPKNRNDIGFLSLLEYHKQYQVGSYYKTPNYPIWIVRLESYLSVVFSLKRDILNDWKAESMFDLFFYDCSNKQDGQIRLTICK